MSWLIGSSRVMRTILPASQNRLHYPSTSQKGTDAPAHVAGPRSARPARDPPVLHRPPGHSPRPGHQRTVVTGHPARLPWGQPPHHRPRTARRADRSQRPRLGRGDAGTARPAAELGDVPPPAPDRMPPLRRPPSRQPGGASCPTTPTSACGTAPGSARPTSTIPAVDLTRLPEIIDAQRHHVDHDQRRASKVQTRVREPAAPPLLLAPVLPVLDAPGMGERFGVRHGGAPVSRGRGGACDWCRSGRCPGPGARSALCRCSRSRAG